MPEFVLDQGAQSARFASLDAFTQGYIEAMFFTADEEIGEGAGLDDLSSAAWGRIRQDCCAFQEGAAHLLELAYGHESGYEPMQAGRDFWYTRNGHGTGFWNRGLGRIGRDVAKWTTFWFSGCSLYRGDDGELYLP